MANQLQNIAQGMQAFGAGIQGNLPQFQRNQTLQKESQQKQEAIQQASEQAMMEGRTKSAYQDAEMALYHAEQGHFDKVIARGISRLQSLKQIEGSDPTDTQLLVQLALGAQNGEKGYAERLQSHLGGIVKDGQVRGYIETPPERKTQVVDGTLIDLITGEKIAEVSASKEASQNIVQVYPENGDPFSALIDKFGNFKDFRGNKITLGEGDRVVKDSTLSGSAEEMGITSNEAEDMRDAEISTTNFLDTVDDALSMLNKSPDINTLVAGGASIVNNLQQEAAAIGRSFGVEINEAMLDPSMHAESFDGLGIDNQRIRSIVTSLAFQAAAAAGQTGRSVSEKDVRRFIEEIGSASSDPRAFEAVLKDVARRTVRNFSNQYRIKMGQDYSGGLSGRFDSQVVHVSTKEEYEALPMGTEYIGPSGKRAVKK